MTFAFEKLRVYQKSVDFADAVCTSTEQFQCGYGFQVNQLNRAALSISSNFAEGNGRFTKADRKHFFGIARASVLQCVPQLELARRRELIDESKHAEFKSQLEEISRMLSGLINGLENRETSTFSTHSIAKKFNWCPVTPTFFKIKPFGEYVKGLSHF